MIFAVILTLTMLEPKLIRLCHQCRARSAWTSILSDQTLHCLLTNFKFFLDFPKINNIQLQKWKVDKSIYSAGEELKIADFFAFEDFSKLFILVLFLSSLEVFEYLIWIEIYCSYFIKLPSVCMAICRVLDNHYWW